MTEQMPEILQVFLIIFFVACVGVLVFNIPLSNRGRK